MERKPTDAEQRAIAEIRRRLDAEQRHRLDAEFGPVEDPGVPPTKSRKAGVLAILLIGMLIGSLLAAWVRYADVQKLSQTRAPAHDLEPGRDSQVTEPEDASGVVALHEALDEWIEATRRGDIPAQMRFYPARVAVYYTWRDVPRDAVHAEKVKVFGAASRLVITTDSPVVEVAPDGVNAVTRFRKQYVIEGPVVRRRGAVLQELRWTRTPEGWLITGERDARVLRSG